MNVLMPQLGETVAEGKITKWFKSPGEAVKPGEYLFEIETDKVSMEVPSTTSGVLEEVRVGIGEVAPVGAIVAVISGAEAAPETLTSLASSPKRRQGPVGVTPSSATIAPGAAASVPIKLDPFFEVRTPSRNYGPARLPGGTVVTPL